MLNRLLGRPDAKTLQAARAIVALREHEGWRHFVALAESLAGSYTPEMAYFSSQEEALNIASKMSFVAGIRRCIGLMDQQRNLLGIKEKEQPCP